MRAQQKIFCSPPPPRGERHKGKITATALLLNHLNVLDDARQFSGADYVSIASCAESPRESSLIKSYAPLAFVCVRATEDGKVRETVRLFVGRQPAPHLHLARCLTPENSRRTVHLIPGDLKGPKIPFIYFLILSVIY